ncbi:MAG: hypothetical protein M3Y08_06100 [Fibrobacterota bacterium]|nr:hypothetical protein [Fibrobacterota bacterium]
MTKIILVIIAFQVVMGIMAKRKARRKAEEAARNPSATKDGESPAVAVRKPQPLWGDSQSEHDDDEEEVEWDEHHKRGEPERARPQRSQDQRHAPAGSGKAAELGKDLLSQLAKELGLEIPGPEQRRPAPRPSPQPPTSIQTTRPAPNPKGTPVARTATVRPTAQAQKAINQAQRMASDAARDSRISLARGHHTGGENVPRRETQNLPSNEASAPMAAASSVARESLFDGESIRRAIILNTILEKPLSLKPRRPGED